MEGTQNHGVLHSTESTMLEEPILIHRESYQSCKCIDEHHNVQSHVVISYRHSLSEHHEETRF
jgi:hypothetical protein